MELNEVGLVIVPGHIPKGRHFLTSSTE
jgi:hypothetical protein